MKNKSSRYNSWIIAFFLAESSVCTTINSFITIPYISVVIMFLLLIALLIFYKSKIKINIRCLIFYLAIFEILIISSILNGFMFVKNYLMYYIVFGLTSLFLISLEYDYKKIVYNILKIYAVVIFIYFVKFRKGFLISESYWSSQMGIAYSFVIPILFCFSYLIFRRKIFSEASKNFSMLALMELMASVYIIIFDCGTRGAIVSVIIGCAWLLIGATDNYKTIMIIIFAMIIMVVFCYQLENMLQWIEHAFLNSNVRSLRKYAQMLAKGNADNGRYLYYQEALDYFKHRPILGNGVGYFEKFHGGTYVHEIIFEVLCEYGIVGFLVLISIFIRFGKQLVYEKVNEKKIFAIILAGILSVLIYSSSYWMLPSFWFSLFFMLTYKKRR